MKYFSCTKNDFKQTVTLEELGCEYFVVNSIEELNPHLNSIQKLIDDFNSYIKWDDMFNIEDVVERIKQGIIIIIAYYKDNPVGYIFINKGWVYNLFISKLNPRPPKTFLSLSNKSFEVGIEKYGIAGWEAEDWNKPMFYVAKQSGCQEVSKSLKPGLVT